jgi:hypothetical protein
MSLGELADPPEQSKAIDVIRADDEVYHFEVDEYSLRTLYPKYLEKNVEFYELKLRPGHDIKSAPHLDGTMEFITVQAGEIEIASGEQTSRLGVGDSAHYPADVPVGIMECWSVRLIFTTPVLQYSNTPN